jgi:hypothetical protein
MTNIIVNSVINSTIKTIQTDYNLDNANLINIIILLKSTLAALNTYIIKENTQSFSVEDGNYFQQIIADMLINYIKYTFINKYL